MRLTDQTVRSLPLPSKGQKTYWDDGLTGFGIRVSQGGSRSFVLQFGADRQLVTLGKYHPDILPLAKARSEAKRILAEQVLGKHRPSSVPFQEAQRLFLEACKRKNKPRTVYDYTRLLNRHFNFGRKQLSDISTADLARKLDRIAAPSEKNYATVLIKHFFNWCLSRGYIDTSPALRFKQHQSTTRSRVLTDSELKSIWRACETGHFGVIVRLLILTGQRRSEIAALQTSWIRDDLITLPATITKNGREHTFPVGQLTCSMLDVDNEAKPSTLLFPSRVSQSRPFSGWSKSKAALDKLSGVTDWTLHDLRRTYATIHQRIGTPLPVIEKLLNHVSGSFAGVVGIYQRHDFLPEMRQAVENFDRYMVKLLRS